MEVDKPESVETTPSTEEQLKDATKDLDETEPPSKKSKVAEEALKKIEAAKLLKEKEKEEADVKAAADRKKELDKLWKVVKDDPTDFTGWTQLLQFVDGKNVLDSGEEAFNAFLKRYPYCYGYWKKFADFEKRNGTPEKIMSVFDQGFAAIPLSTDLWIHYMNYCKTVHKEDVEFIRSQYERAMAACGREWRSDKLWDHYIKWEMEAKNYTEVFQLYERILRIPTHGLAKNLEAFLAFLKDQNPKDLMDTVDFLTLRKEIINAKNSLEGSKDDEKAPGEDTENDLNTAEETQAMREKIFFNVKKAFKETEDRMNVRLKYEEGIKRPYFHVKALERGQLKNWHDYIEFMKTEMMKEGGDITEVEILYERSLIACALYEEFWMSYISWWESRDGDNVTKIRSIYKRACLNHLPTNIDLHEKWAEFEERQGDFEAAGTIYENLMLAHPLLVGLRMKRINVERRKGNYENVCNLFESAIKDANDKSVASDLSIKFARYLRLQKENRVKASKVISDAIEMDKTNSKLYLQQMDILINSSPMDVNRIVEVIDEALKEVSPEKQKLVFAQRKVEFLEDFGSDVNALQVAKREFQEVQNKESASAENGAPKDANAANDGTENKNGSATYPPINNSSSYTAQHAQAYNNYGARYGSYPQNFGQQYGGGGATGY